MPGLYRPFFFFLGPRTACFLEYPSRVVNQVKKKSSEAGAEHSAGLVVCAKGLWPGFTHWSGDWSPRIAFVSWASLCFASADVCSILHLRNEKTPFQLRKLPLFPAKPPESEGPNQ